MIPSRLVITLALLVIAGPAAAIDELCENPKAVSVWDLRDGSARFCVPHMIRIKDVEVTTGPDPISCTATASGDVFYEEAGLTPGSIATVLSGTVIGEHTVEVFCNNGSEGVHVVVDGRFPGGQLVAPGLLDGL